MKPYNEFLSEKFVSNKPSGFMVDMDTLNPNLKDWQALLVRWALYKGKSALFEGTGLGKTIQQLAWADAIYKHTGKNVIGYAPLAVSHQTVREGSKFGIVVNRCDTQADVRPGINITNYERIDKFDHDSFAGVFLDESGRIKNDTASFRNAVINYYGGTPYRLCCSATPSPNDYTELGNTAEFLGVSTMAEMKAMYFINDSGKTTAPWRLKGHVKDNRFWEWLATWCVMIQKPSDIGYDDTGYILPKLVYHEHIIKFTGEIDTLFVEHAEGLREVEESMKETLDDRCNMIADMVNGSDETWAVWCHRNPEGELLSKLINESVEVSGQTPDDLKVKHILDFADDKVKCLITKPKIGMFGLNLQNCCNVIVTGLSYSFEALYQLVRRFYRYGQTRQVNVHIVIGEREGHVLATIKRKEKQMEIMFDSMARHMSNATISELKHTKRSQTVYDPKIEMELPTFLVEAA